MISLSFWEARGTFINAIRMVIKYSGTYRVREFSDCVFGDPLQTHLKLIVPFTKTSYHYLKSGLSFNKKNLFHLKLVIKVCKPIGWMVCKFFRSQSEANQWKSIVNGFVFSVRS